MRLFWLIGLVFVFILTIKLGSPLVMFYDPYSIFPVIGCIAFIPLAKFGFREVLSYSDDVVLGFINSSVIGGCFGVAIGAIQLLSSSSMSKFYGASCAYLGLPAFYSMLAVVGFYASKKDITFKKVSLAILGLAVLIIIPVVGLAFKN